MDFGHRRSVSGKDRGLCWDCYLSAARNMLWDSEEEQLEYCDVTLIADI